MYNHARQYRALREGARFCVFILCVIGNPSVFTGRLAVLCTCGVDAVGGAARSQNRGGTNGSTYRNEIRLRFDLAGGD